MRFFLSFMVLQLMPVGNQVLPLYTFLLPCIIIEQHYSAFLFIIYGVKLMPVDV